MVEYNIPRSVSYHNLIIREIDNLTSLKADEETKRDHMGLKVTTFNILDYNPSNSPPI